MKHRRTKLDASTACQHLLYLTSVLVSLLSCYRCKEGEPSQDAAHYHLMSYDSQDLTNKVIPRRFATVVLR